MKQQPYVFVDVQHYVAVASLFPNSACSFKTNICNTQKWM
jgi:hypothetical protein